MRVLINAQLSAGHHGGVEQVLIGLASGLAEVAQPGEEYLFLTEKGTDSWLRPYVRGACSIVQRRAEPHHRIRRLLKRVPGVAQMYRALRANSTAAAPVPGSGGIAERLQADVVHFPYQLAFVTSIPSIYQPWDLQHIHHPEFFTAEQRATRDHWYRTFCSQARVVSVATEFGKHDLVSHLQVTPEKIEVIPMAPVLTAYSEPSDAEVSAMRAKLALPEQFAYYPARTWPHKNHLALIQALALLRSRGSIRHAVFSGAETPHADVIRAEAKRLGVREQVSFLGFVSPAEVRCLYRLATCLVFPSRFEGFGLPVTEAFLSGLPVASSNASCLPETTAGAALLFDPDDTGAIAGAIERLSTDEALRRDLIARGHEVVANLSWRTTGARFRDLYRRLANG